MKFQDLKNSLKEKVCMNYLLYGVDEFLLTSAYNLIHKFSGIEFEDLNLIKFTEGIIDCDVVVRACDTMPVFSNRKLVYLDLRMSKKSEIKNIDALSRYLAEPNAQTVLVVNIGDNEEVFSLDKKLFVEVDCGRLDYKIVSLKIKATISGKGKVIDDDATKLLFDYSLGDMAKALLECEKLCGYVGDRKDIVSADIKEVVSPSLEYQIFELTEALSKKNASKVYTILDDMRSKKDEYRTLPAIIYSHFRRLFMVALNKNMTNFDLAKMLFVKEYAIKMTAQQVKLFSVSKLKKINELCIKMDSDLKQSNISIDNAINLLVLQILNM
ncbi:MAG: DNA polymerase III subunit delta [Clostridiales bacterium]|nr:DNA polymerase III subunit delta [Clostridiales bacterium]